MGVAFLSHQTPGEDEKTIRNVLEMKKATLPFALDHDRKRDTEFDRNGVTADRYGVKGYPTLVLIDRQGKVAFHTGISTREGVAAMRAIGKEMGLDESTMTEADSYRLWECHFGLEIDKVLDRR